MQGWPPVAVVLTRNSLVVVGAVRMMGVEVRFVRVKRIGALVLWMGTDPKSCASGVRMSPAWGRPVPVRAMV